MKQKFGDNIWQIIKPFVRLEMLFIIIIGSYILNALDRSLSTYRDFSAIVISVDYNSGVYVPKSGRGPAYYLVSVKLENGEVGRVEHVDSTSNLYEGTRITVTKRIFWFGKTSYYLKKR